MYSIEYLPYLQNLITLAIIYTLAVISPGSCFAIVIRNSLFYSRKHGFWTACGVSVGILIHASYTILGVGALIHSHEILFQIIQGAGALYLIYIGLCSLKSKILEDKSFKINNNFQSKFSEFKAFKMGFMTNILNPMVIVFFISIFASVMAVDTPKPVQLIYVMVMSGIALIWFSSVAFFFSSDKIRAQFLKMDHWLERITGVTLIILGLKIIITMTLQIHS